MAKKSFLDNPAMRFITLDEAPKAVEPEGSDAAAPRSERTSGRKKPSASENTSRDVYTHDGDNINTQANAQADARVDMHAGGSADMHADGSTDVHAGTSVSEPVNMSAGALGTVADPSVGTTGAIPGAGNVNPLARKDGVDPRAPGAPGTKDKTGGAVTPSNEGAASDPHVAAGMYRPDHIEAYIAAYQPTPNPTHVDGDTAADEHTYPHAQQPMQAHGHAQMDVDANARVYADASNDPYTHAPTYNPAVSDSSPMFLPRRESKSKRLQLLIKPSTHAQLLRIARAHDTSVNDAVNAILEDYIRKSL